MALLKVSLALLVLSTKIVMAKEFTEQDQEEQHRNAKCTNDCLFDVWTEGYCVDDPACQCNNKDKREAYICCVAEKCVTDYWQHALELTSDNCDAFGIPFTFDVEDACGFTPPTSSESSSADSSSATKTVTSTETLRDTNSSPTGDSKAEAESASETASPTESQTGGQSAETSSPPNGAVGREISWAGMAVLAAGAGVLV